MAPNELFDLITEESFYGLNMTKELNHLNKDNPTLYAEMVKFFKQCKKARSIW